jgi:hypothetical protein
MRRAVVLGAMLALPGCTKDPVEPQPTPAAGPPTDEAASPHSAGSGDDGIGLGNAIAEAVGLATATATAGPKLLPGSATMLAGVDLAAIARTTAWENVQAMLTAGPAKVFHAATTCKLGPDTWKRAFLAADPTTEDSAVVIEAGGVGRRDTLVCLHNELERALGRAPWTLDDSATRFEFDDGVGLVVSEDVLVVTTTGWEQAVKQRREGEGTAAGGGELEPLLRRTDQRKHVWFAASLPPEARGTAAAVGMPATDLTGWFDLGSGLQLHLAAGVDEPAVARSTLDKKWADAAPMVGALGISQAVVDSVKFGESDGAVTIDAQASNADLQQMGETISKMF